MLWVKNTEFNLGLTQSNLRKTNGREFEGVALNWGVAPNPLKSGFYLSRCVNPVIAALGTVITDTVGGVLRDGISS
jgi:hypothetical protein